MIDMLNNFLLLRDILCDSSESLKNEVSEVTEVS